MLFKKFSFLLSFPKSALLLIAILLLSLPTLLSLPNLTTVTPSSMVYLILLFTAFNQFKMHLQEQLSLPFAVPITFLLLFVPCIGFLFPNALHSRLLLSRSKHYRIINLPIFAIFSFLTVPLIHFALLTSICSPYLSSNLPKLVDLSSLLLQLSGILFVSLSVLQCIISFSS